MKIETYRAVHADGEEEEGDVASSNVVGGEKHNVANQDGETGTDKVRAAHAMTVGHKGNNKESNGGPDVDGDSQQLGMDAREAHTLDDRRHEGRHAEERDVHGKFNDTVDVRLDILERAEDLLPAESVLNGQMPVVLITQTHYVTLGLVEEPGTTWVAREDEEDERRKADGDDALDNEKP